MIPGKAKNRRAVTSIEDGAQIKIEGRNGKETVIKWSELKTLLNSELDFTTKSAVDAGAYGGYSYTEVSVNTSAIKTLNSSPTTLLAAPGAGKYYEYKIDIESTISTPFTFTGILFVQNSGGDTLSAMHDDLITETGSRAIIVSNIAPSKRENAQETAFSHPNEYNTAIELGASADPTGALAAGSLLVKIWYKVITAGTEL